MNIAVFTDFYFPTIGGVQTSVKSQKEALEALGHKVFIFCPSPSHGDPSVITLPTITFMKWGDFPVAGPFKKVLIHAKKIFTRHDIDIIHCHTNLPVGIAGLVIARQLGIPVVQTMHGRDDSFAQNALPFPDILSIIPAFVHSRYLPHQEISEVASKQFARTPTARRMWRLMVSHANAADHIIVPSKHFAEKLQLAGVTKPLSIVSNALEESVLAAIPSITPRSYDGIRELRIMWCSRLSPEKRLLDFLQSCALLNRNVRVDVYGDGPDLKKGRRLVHSHNMEKQVAFHGSVGQNRIIKEMLGRDVLVFTSYNFDNQPMVLLEAVAAGLPVIFCDPDMAEFLPPEGSLVTSDPSPKAIASVLNSLVDEPERIANMSQAMLQNREAIQQSTQIKHLLAVYHYTIAKYASILLTPSV